MFTWATVYGTPDKGEAVRGKRVEKGEVCGYPGSAQSPHALVSLEKHSSGGDTPHLSDLCLLYVPLERVLQTTNISHNLNPVSVRPVSPGLYRLG